MTKLTHNFDEIVDRRGTDAKKYLLYPEDVLPMWIADSDFKAPQPVIDALTRRIAQGVYGYPAVSGRLKRAAARWQTVRFGWDVDPDWVEYVPGVIAGMICAVRALSRPGDGIVIQSPCYPPFADLAAHNGRRLLRNQLILRDGHYEIDFEDFEKKASDPRTRLFILCNPHNPTGRVFTREELTRLGEICLRHHVVVLADEIHHDLVYAGNRHIPFAGLSPELAARTVSFMNPSKTFNVPGFRTAAFIAENPLLKDAVHQVVVDNKAFGENLCGTIAFCTAYEACDYYADQLTAYLDGNRRMLAQGLERVPEIRMIPSEGTYFAWLDCRALGMEQDALDQFFVDRVKLGLNSGRSFGPDGAGFLRLNFACPRAVAAEAVERIVTQLTALRKT